MALRYALMRLPEEPEMLKSVAFSPPKRYNMPEIDEDEDDYDNYTTKGWLDYV